MKRVLAIILALTILPFHKALAQSTKPSETCDDKGYVIGFFNGVWNDYDGAVQGMMRIQFESGFFENPTYKGQSVSFELFYNRTNGWKDILETFIQRANEIDESIAEKLELFTIAIHGANRDDTGFISATINKLKATYDIFSDFFDKVYSYSVNAGIKSIEDLAASSLTPSDIKRHADRIQILSFEGKKFLIVAHSQGNLFANVAYKTALDSLGYNQGSISLLHIAPPTSFLNGPYILNTKDIVINGLNLFGTSTVPPSNIQLPFSFEDVSGHRLAETYLDPTREAHPYIVNKISNMVAQLEDQPGLARTGYVTITLTWDGPGDVDLHTKEPKGKVVYYGDQRGLFGELDIDNTSAYGPEHYSVGCLTENIEGRYRVGATNYARALGRTAEVTLSTLSEGVIWSAKTTFDNQRGSPEFALFDFEIFRTSTGRLTTKVYPFTVGQVLFQDPITPPQN